MRIRFREIKEIREIKDEKKEEENKNYLKIKPETDITIEEAREFWDAIFKGEDD